MKASAILVIAVSASVPTTRLPTNEHEPGTQSKSPDACLNPFFNVDHFPKGDKGGNEILLTKGKNLHSLWDNLLGRDSKMSGVAKAVAELSDKERFGNVWDLSAQETDPIQWAKESHDLAEAVVYDDAILDAVRKSPTGEKVKMTPVELPVEYYKAAGEQARKRALAAGLRLGALLKTLNQ